MYFVYFNNTSLCILTIAQKYIFVYHIDITKQQKTPRGDGNMTIFETRYQAQKERATNPFFNGTEKVIKVCGGYALMDAAYYRVWKMQK